MKLKQAAPSKYALGLLVASALLFGNCGGKKSRNENDNTAAQAGLASTYCTTTQQLKSNTIPDAIFQLTSLKELSIQGMDCDYGGGDSCWALKAIPRQISRLQKLESLLLPVNNISVLPDELSSLPELKRIDLSDNPGLSTVASIPKMHNLEQLFLYGCNLTVLPKNIGELKNLKKLGLTGNNFDDAEKMRIKKALPTCKVTF